MIALLFIGSGFLLFSFFFEYVKRLLDGSEVPSGLTTLTFIVGVAMVIAVTLSLITDTLPRSYNKGQIDALKGIQTHEIHYVYPEGSAIPSDTLYLKIER